MPISSRTIVAGRYDLEDQLGRGGMGVVWRANDTLLKRKVAIKEVRLPDTLPESEQASMQARALREARAAARIGHPAAVTVFDVHKEDGRAFIVMELVDAPTLEEMVRTQGPLTPEKTAEVALGILSALEAAHQQGIVHRDVKPANVMVLSDGRVKLADFGIASLKDDPKITATGLVLGSPSFMSPEQAEGHRSGAEADLWALGATMFFAVDGSPPFDKGQPIPTLTAVLHDDMPTPARAGHLEPVIRALLRKSPGDRPISRGAHKGARGRGRRECAGRIRGAGVRPRRGRDPGPDRPSRARPPGRLPRRGRPSPSLSGRRPRCLDAAVPCPWWSRCWPSRSWRP